MDGHHIINRKSAKEDEVDTAPATEGGILTTQQQQQDGVIQL